MTERPADVGPGSRGGWWQGRGMAQQPEYLLWKAWKKFSTAGADDETRAY